MYIEYSRDNFNTEEEIEIIELSEEVENKIKNLAEDLGLLTDVKYEEEEGIEEVVIDFNKLIKPTPPPEKPINYDEIRKSVIEGDLKFSRTIEYIDINQLIEIDDSINFFEKPDDQEFCDLLQNIQTYKVIEPLIVIKDESSEKYKVVCGRSRLFVSRALYANSGLEKYLYLPCIVLDNSTSHSLIQAIVISTNMRYRKISRKTLMKSIFLLDEILKTSKRSKNEMNIAGVIADQAGVSRSTVNNYTALKNLSPKAMDLVFKKHMNLQVAKLLAREDHEKQDSVIEALKENINDLPKVVSLLTESKSIYDEKEKKAMPATWERKVEFVNKITPKLTQITAKVPNTAVEECLNALLVVRKNYAIKYMKTYPGDNSNQFFRVKFNENHMKQYIDRGYLKQDTFDKVKAKKFKDVINI